MSLCEIRKMCSHGEQFVSKAYSLNMGKLVLFFLFLFSPPSGIAAVFLKSFQ